MRRKIIIVAAIATVLTVAAPASFGAVSQVQSGGKVTVRIEGTNDRQDVTDGGVAGTGHFTASGAITDKAQSPPTGR